jgi:5,10-methenyltetrahydrofolate synthetase
MMDPSVAAWRRQKRAALLAERQALSSDERKRAAEIVARSLDEAIAMRRGLTVGLYWPIRQEINLLAWADALVRRGDTVLCLPVVVTKQAALEYWRWQQGEPLARGIWDIPVPARRDVVVPDLVLAPLVGFDRRNFRLGYGGGYFDRTLAALRPRPTVIGVGYEFSALETIDPQPHDIPMDAVLTERRTTPSIEWRKHAN